MLVSEFVDKLDRIVFYKSISNDAEMAVHVDGVLHPVSDIKLDTNGIRTGEDEFEDVIEIHVNVLE